MDTQNRPATARPVTNLEVIELLQRYGTGRSRAADKRDTNFRMAALIEPPQVMPRYRYYRTGPILDQGASPHCVGYSWRQWLSSAPRMTKSGPSAQEIYTGAQDNDEWPGNNYDGSSVRGGSKWLQAQGYIKYYVWADTAEDIRNWLMSGKGTVVMGTTWRRDMFYPSPEGLVTPTGAFAGGHAYLCTGYNHVRGLFRFTNAWGVDWGQSGRFWMAGEHLDQLMQDEGEACAAIEQDVPKLAAELARVRGVPVALDLHRAA